MTTSNDSEGNLVFYLLELMELVRFDNRITRVSNGGHSLSRGQRKKLLMMKLILRYKLESVIILDEIEEVLDAETKDIILRFNAEFCGR